MELFGGIVVILAFAAIIKKVEARMVLLLAGFIMLVVGGKLGSFVGTFTKTMTHNTLVPVICTVMGFSFVMKVTECDKHLVSSISGVISKLKFVIIPVAMLLTWWINIAIPSAAGCAAAVGSILIPTLMAMGVHPAMAGATVLAGTWGSAISPGTSHNPIVAAMAGMTTEDVIFHEAPMAIIASLVVVAAVTVIAIFFKEGPNAERARLYNGGEGGSDAAIKVNPLKAITPLVPLVLLILNSKQIMGSIVANGGMIAKLASFIVVDVPGAMMVGAVLGMIVSRTSPVKVTKEFFDGMGSAFGGVIGLIIAASVFTSGMAAVGLTKALIQSMNGSAAIAKIAGAFGPFLIAIVSGSGDAAALAFNNAITPHAASFGMTIVDLGSLAQIAGAVGRSASPVAGAAIICATLAKVNPMELTKRNIIPMILGTIALILLF